MTDAERIRALVDRGTLDAAQADRLLAALADLDAQEAPPADDARAAPGTVDATSATSARRWLRIQRRTARLEVCGDEAIQAPVIDEAPDGTTLVSDGASWRLDAGTGDDVSWTRRLLRDATVPVTRLRVPIDVGLEVDVAVGSVEVDEVPAVRGRVVTGEIEIESVQHVDVHVTAGEVDVEMEPADATHRIRVDTGTVKVRLPRHADVTVEGSIRVGDAHVSEPFREHGRGVVGRTIDGRLGEGRATLRVDVGTGSLTVQVR